MTPERYALVLNPDAGRGRAVRAWPRLERELRARKLSCEAIVAASAAEALARVQALPLGTAVVAVGGDGTASGLLPAVVHTGRPFGLLPMGSGNDLAGALGVPRTLAGAVAHLQRPARALDVLEVRFEGHRRYCLNGLGMGFDARVAALSARSPKALGGPFRYALGALQAVRELRASGLQVWVDGAEVFSGESFLAAVMNGTRYGGGFYISPLSDLTDGLADVLVGARVGHPGLLSLMPRVLRGRHLGHPKVTHGRGRAVSLRWAEAAPLHVDGDLFVPTRDVQVKLLAGGVLMLGA